MPASPALTPVVVVWEDAQVHDNGPWLAVEDAGDIKPVVVRQIGFLLEHTRERLVICHAYHESQMSPREVIPTGMIRSIHELVTGKPISAKPRRKYATIKGS